MAIPSRQIGWSQESNLIWEVLRQLNQLTNVTSKAGGGGYKVYTALLNQSGTDAPVATVLENTLGGTPVWTRSGVGTYQCTLNGAFTPNKTFCSAMVGPVWGAGQLQFNFGINTIDYCELNLYYAGVGNSDSGNDPGNDICVEIRVYP